MTRLELFLFGSPRLEQAGHTIEVRPRKALALFIYLGVTEQPHSRDALATLFWSESDQVAARASLRRTLHRLQQALPEGILTVSTETIRLTPQSGLWLDVTAFRTATTTCLQGSQPVDELSHECRQQLIEAVDLYTGDFLAGFTLEDSPEFDEWHFFQQESLRRTLAQIVVQLKHLYAREGEYERAIEYARRWLALDPLHEVAHRELMQLYAWAGQQAAAVRQYQECRRILDEELGVPPAPETTELYEAIRLKRLPIPQVAPSVQNQPVLTLPNPAPLNPASTNLAAPNPASVAPAAPSSPSPNPGAAEPSSGTGISHNLPPHFASFVGREVEVATIRSLLSHDEKCRLLVLVGPSGIGKSRLALQAVQQFVESQPDTDHTLDDQLSNDQPVAYQFEDGVIFVSLLAVNDPNGIVPAIADAAGLHFSGGLPTKEQLLNYLRNKRMLLLLDQFEHLMAGAPLLAEILNAAPDVKIVVTSLEGIKLQEAWLLPVGSLAFPTKDHLTQVPVKEYDAIRLFDQQARRIRVGFSLEAELPHVVRICQLVEGMPLALELAATWLTVLPAEGIAAEIEQSLDILSARHEGVPARHRSMRVVLEHSWNLLNDAERSVFMRLAIFRGGFDAAAAKEIAGASLMMLAALVDKSLLQLDNDGRYQSHELLRHFAADQLQADNAAFAQVRAQHSGYYMRFLQQCSREIKTERQKAALAQIAAEIGNVHIAWQYAVAQRNVQELLPVAQCLLLFSHYRGLLDEGEAAFAHAIESLTAVPASDVQQRAQPAEQALLGFLHAGQGWMCARRGDSEKGRSLMEQGIALLRAANLQGRATEALALAYLALIAQGQGNYLEAWQIGQQSLDIFTEIGDLWGIAMSLEVMGSAAVGYGQLEEAKQLLRSSLGMGQAIGEQRSRLFAMNHLGMIALAVGDYGEAQANLEQALATAKELGDRFGIAVSLTHLGKLATEQGNYIQAKEYLEGALAIMRAAGVSYNSVVFELLSTGLCRQGDYEEAEKMGRQALQMAQARRDPQRIAGSLSVLGRLAYAQQEYAQAEELQKQALALCQEMGHEPDTAAILRYLGDIYLGDIALAMGDETRVAGAWRYYQSALELALKHRLAPIALDIFARAGEWLQQQGETARDAGLLLLASRHPAANYTTKTRARQLLREHEQMLEASHSQGQALDWQAAATQLLQQWSRPNWAKVQPVARNLPSQSTPFVGREQEVASIIRNLQNPDCRLLTLIGLGGIGKTRLAIQVAQRLIDGGQAQDLFNDGIVFVPLAPVNEPEGIVPAIAEAAGITLHGSLPVKQQLLEMLRAKQMLLVLDNFEHLEAGARLIAELLTAAPALKILLTARVALHLQEAWFYPIGGMSFPSGKDQAGRLPEEYEAVQLFAQCAKRARAGFELQAAMAPVMRICRLVEGMPLAIELAAAWLKVLTVEDVAHEIEHNLDILTAHQGTLPARHQSMRVVLEQSWAKLSADEQQVFMALAVFRGGFRRDAAEVVAGAGLLLLSALMDKALLWLAENGRYSMHELVRQFAVARLKESPYAEQHTQEQYSRYYLEFLADRMHALISPQQQTALAEIEEEIENVSSSWQWALAHNDLEAIERSVSSYKHFLYVRGPAKPAEEIFSQALRYLEGSEAAHSHPRFAIVHQILSHETGSFNYFLGNLRAACEHLETALAEAERMGNTPAVAHALATLGTIVGWQGRVAVGEQWLQAALAIMQELGDRQGEADKLHELSRLALYRGEYEEAKRRAAESLAVSKTLNRPDWIAYAHVTYGAGCLYLGEYAESRYCYQEGLALFEEGKHQLGIALALGGLSWVLWATGGAQRAEAERYALRSLEICRRIGHGLQTAHRLAVLAQFANERGDHVSAERYSQEGAALAAQMGNPLFLAQNLCCLAEAAYARGDFGAGRRHLARACRETVAAEMGSRLVLVLLHAGHLLLAEAEGLDLDLHERMLRQAKAIQWLELYLNHPASWHMFKERAVRRLAYVRAQAPDAVELAAQTQAVTGTLEAMIAEVSSWNSATTTQGSFAGQQLALLQSKDDVITADPT